MLSQDLLNIRSFADSQKKIFSILPLKSDFNEGIIQGLNLILQYLELKDDAKTESV